HLSIVRCPLFEGAGIPHELSGIGGGEALRQLQHVVAGDRAEHGTGLSLTGTSATEGDELIEKRQTIPHAAVGGLRNEREAGRLEPNAFLLQNGAQVGGNLRDRNPLEVELQAAREHGDRQLLRVGGGQQEFHVLRRLLERLQERVEGMRREHVYLIDQVHLVTPAGGGVLHVVEQL